MARTNRMTHGTWAMTPQSTAVLSNTAGPFLGNELPMPAHERVGRHHGRDVTEDSTPDAMRPRGKPSPGPHRTVEGAGNPVAPGGLDSPRPATR